jgi:hypothetical protein
MGSGNFVAVGSITPRDLDVWGSGFRRAYPPTQTTKFDVLLDRIDELDHQQERHLEGLA